MLSERNNYIKHTNIDNDMMAYCYLSKEGFGSINELMQLDTKEFLDIIEYCEIRNYIESYEYDRAKS